MLITSREGISDDYVLKNGERYEFWYSISKKEEYFDSTKFSSKLYETLRNFEDIDVLYTGNWVIIRGTYARDSVLAIIICIAIITVAISVGLILSKSDIYKILETGKVPLTMWAIVFFVALIIVAYWLIKK